MKLLKIILPVCMIVSLMGFYPVQPGKNQIEKGKQLSKSCTNCHGTNSTAKSLKNIRNYRSKEWIYSITQNPFKYASKNPKVKELFEKKGVWMQAFPTLTNVDIDAILDYIDSQSQSPKR